MAGEHGDEFAQEGADAEVQGGVGGCDLDVQAHVPGQGRRAQHVVVAGHGDAAGRLAQPLVHELAGELQVLARGAGALLQEDRGGGDAEPHRVLRHGRGLGAGLVGPLAAGEDEGDALAAGRPPPGDAHLDARAQEPGHLPLNQAGAVNDDEVRPRPPPQARVDPGVEQVGQQEEADPGAGEHDRQRQCDEPRQRARQDDRGDAQRHGPRQARARQQGQEVRETAPLAAPRDDAVGDEHHDEDQDEERGQEREEEDQPGQRVRPPREDRHQHPRRDEGPRQPQGVGGPARIAADGDDGARDDGRGDEDERNHSREHAPIVAGGEPAILNDPASTGHALIVAGGGRRPWAAPCDTAGPPP